MTKEVSSSDLITINLWEFHFLNSIHRDFVWVAWLHLPQSLTSVRNLLRGYLFTLVETRIHQSVYLCQERDFEPLLVSGLQPSALNSGQSLISFNVDDPQLLL